MTTATDSSPEQPVKTVRKYGLDWKSTDPALWVEMVMIQKGGQYKKKEKTYGNGLFFHFKEAIRILWPEVVQHRWFDFILERWLKYTYVGIVGPKNASKTNTMAIVHLMDYYCFPDETTVMVCSTTKEMLENRIWGEMKKYHKLAKLRFDWIPGYLTEGRQRIVTDSKDEFAEGRDFRNGCFPNGEMVDTPTGPIPIEQIRNGQIVLTATGHGVVTKTFHRISPSLIRVKLSDGRKIDCTEEHPFFTNRGWIKAIDLEISDMVFSHYETMQIMREANSEQYHILLSEVQRIQSVPNMRKTSRKRLSKQKVLLGHLPKFSPISGMRSMFKEVQASKPAPKLEKFNRGKIYRKILQHYMRQSLGGPAQGMLSGIKSKMFPMRERDEECSLHEKILFHSMQEAIKANDLFKMWKGVSVLKGQTKVELLQVLQQSVPHGSTRANHGIQIVPRICNGISSEQTFYRRGISRNKTSSGSGWKISLKHEKERFEKNKGTKIVRVDSVEILKQSGDERFDVGKGGYSVNNISVSGHPSYSVNGVIVHNCQGIPLKKGGRLAGMEDVIGIKNKRKRLCADEIQCLPKSILDGTANFLEPGADCKVTGMGNPSDITDALGVLCEPHVTLGGWDGGIDQTPKTKSWKTRFDNGICIQLPGSDSPNNDVPEGEPIPYPFLMTKSQMEKDARTWGKEDWHYLMFNEGRFPRGQGSRRVITRQLCLKNHALEDPVWLNSTRTYITCLDAAYRSVGGDRCVLMRLAFGPETKSDIDAGTALAESLINQKPQSVSNRIIIALLDTIIVPIKSSEIESPEDQIVMFVKMQHERWGIGPEQHFFDAGMRTSLVSAYSRLWSPKVNTLDFGGKPSLRQVSHDIVTPCREYYSKRVTEIWFNWRLAIESEQVRGMTEDLMQEGCLREWTLVAGNKTEVESKSDMREKCGRSPDLADCFCIGLWGAIERGFVVRRMLSEDSVITDDRWKRELREKAKKVWHGSSLVHSV